MDESPTKSIRRLKINKRLEEYGIEDLNTVVLGDPKMQQSQGVLFTDYFKLRGLIGKGQYGVVLLVLNILEEALSALKIICKANLHQQEVSVIKSEALILQKLKGQKHIVQIKNVSPLTTLVFRNGHIYRDRNGILGRHAALESVR
jgi:serine/threonine protein kinase